MRQHAAALLAVLCSTSFATAQFKPDRLTEFLQNYQGEQYPRFEQQERHDIVLPSSISRTMERRKSFVYLSGRGWCGTGGCNMLVLAPEGTSYRVVTRTTITRLPIRVLATKSKG